MQLLAELSPKDATVFALVTDAASQTTAKSLSVSTGEALSPILDEVQTLTCCWVASGHAWPFRSSGFAGREKDAHNSRHIG